MFVYIFPGYPQPKYRWMKDGVFLSDFSSEHFYKIQSVSRSDAGNYRCYSKNSVGTIISENIKLTVACKFLKPKFIQLSPIRPTSLGGLILSYFHFCARYICYLNSIYPFYKSLWNVYPLKRLTCS